LARPARREYSDFLASGRRQWIEIESNGYDFDHRQTEGTLFQLSKEHVAFVESGVSVVLASRDSQNRPFLGRASGCHVAADGRIKIFISRRKYPFLLDAIRRTGAVAASFSEPSTNKSLQIKGAGAQLAELDPGDIDRIADHLNLFAADVERIGLRAALPRTVLAAAAEDLQAVVFVPAVAFIQTPGPVAGNQIGA
jgi:hypothetical protein